MNNFPCSGLFFSVGGNLLFNNPLWAGAITTISGDEADRNVSSFLINSGANVVGNTPAFLYAKYSKVGIEIGSKGVAANLRANFAGNILSKSVGESYKKQENE